MSEFVATRHVRLWSLLRLLMLALLAWVPIVAPLAAQTISAPAPVASPAPIVSRMIMIEGDSNALGTADDASTAAWTAAGGNNGHIWILNAAGNWVLANPGVSGFSGLHFGSNGTSLGPWMGAAIYLMAKYPTIDWYFDSDTASGSYQSIGVSTGTATVSITSPNTLTVNSGTVGGNEVITGAGLIDSLTGKTLYSPFSGFVSTVGSASNPTVTTVSSVTATRYNGTLSWDVDRGLIYNGNSGVVNNGARFRAASAFSKLPGVGQIVCDVVVLGDNDKAQTATANLYQSAFLTRLARKRADLPMAGVRTSLWRVRTVGTAAATIRTAVANIIGIDPLVKMRDNDGATVSADGIHYRQTSLNSGGAGSMADCGL